MTRAARGDGSSASGTTGHVIDSLVLVLLLVSTLLLALPVVLVVLLGARAKQFLPRVRDWMSSNSWIVSEVVIVFFMAITISSLAS